MHFLPYLVALLTVLSRIPVAHSLTVVDESSSNLARWKEKWDTNTIGWHADDINDAIKVHGDKLLKAHDSCTVDMRVFVPLCGKSLDVAFFAQHADVTEVVGVDGIKKALLEFADEHPDLDLKEMAPTKSYEVLKGNKITLLKGDFFELDDVATGGKFAAVYDRASL